MGLSQSERVRWVVKWLSGKLKITTADVGKRLGYPSNTYFSQVINGKKPMAASLIEKLAAMDPAINIDFLTGVSDEMLVGEESAGVSPEPAKVAQLAPPRVGIYVPAELAQMVTDMTATIREQQSMIRTLVDAWCKKEDEK